MAEQQVHVNEELQVEAATGRISVHIMGTLLGGTLLLSALLALAMFDAPEASQILAGVATILLGGPLVWWALRDLAQGRRQMNELVALAVLAAMSQGWYLVAGTIAFFMIIAGLIVNRTALGAQASIESLIRITPTRAMRLIRRDRGTEGPTGESTDHGAEAEQDAEQSILDDEEEVEAKDLHPGDMVRVRPGDNIPADGRIVRGVSTVNEANITGESLPADKVEGDEVFGGTINLTGVIEVEVTKAGEDTTLGRVKDLILEAERTRIPIMRMIDRYTAWYTPTVLMVVFIVWFFTHRMNPANPEEAWNKAIALLVIACPFALILATPTAMVAALSSAARLGVLVKNVVDLEAARNLTAMVFDKTGTLTTGQLEVARLAPAEGVEGVDLLRAAASVEQNSRHPVARAVTQVARKAKLTLGEVDDFEEVAGKGVKATVAGRDIRVGRGNWFTAEQVGTDGLERIQQTLTSSEAAGLSTLFVARDGQLLGWVGLADNTRPEAAEAMDELRGIGLKRLIIVTGDRESVAQRIASQMHTEYKAEVLPHEKLEMVDQLKGRGHRVAVVGDGVNDAPALAAGDISIAMGAAGSDVAIHSANIALMNNNLNRLPFLVRLSKTTSNVIWQNMSIGVGVIVGFLAMISAFEVPMPMVLAAVLQVVGLLAVVFNSARLVRSGEDIEHAEHQALAQRQEAPPASAQPPAKVSPAAVPA